MGRRLRSALLYILPVTLPTTMDQITAIQELQNKGGTDEEWEQLLRQQRAKLWAALRDRMNADYGIKESDFKLEILEKLSLRFSNKPMPRMRPNSWSELLTEYPN